MATVDDEASDRADPHRARIRAWTTQLYREHENIAFRYRLPLRPPLLAIAPMPSGWGRWDPATRQLTISEALIRQHPWDAVLEVLKHEMAHQVVSEILGHDDSTHQASFQQACGLLGVSDWGARASSAPPVAVERWSGRALSDEEEHLLKRADKLLALASSSNEHEAALAMQRVQELYARHNIEQARRGTEPEIVFTLIGRKRRRVESTESTILAILVEHFFVRVIHIRLYDAQDLCEYCAAEVIGSPANVVIAEYVYTFLWRVIDTLWRNFRAATAATVGARRSYQMGVLAGFRDKLGAEQSVQKAAAAAGLDARESQALIRLVDRSVDRFLGRRHPRVVTKQSARARFDHASFSAGVQDGKQVTLRKGIEEKRGNRGRLLPE